MTDTTTKVTLKTTTAAINAIFESSSFSVFELGLIGDCGFVGVCKSIDVVDDFVANFVVVGIGVVAGSSHT